MRVKKRYYPNGSGSEVATAELIEMGAVERSGRIEDLEAKVSHLTAIVAALIDRAGLSADEVLKITGADYVFEPDV